MRVQPRKDFAEISRQSIQRDFQHSNTKKEFKKKPHRGQRIARISENCNYAKEARFFVGKLVELAEQERPGTTSGWYTFVYEDDQKALNAHMGWSDKKDRYLLTAPTFR